MSEHKNDELLRLAAQQLSYMASHGGEESEELKRQRSSFKKCKTAKNWFYK